MIIAATVKIQRNSYEFRRNITASFHASVLNLGILSKYKIQTSSLPKFEKCRSKRQSENVDWNRKFIGKNAALYHGNNDRFHISHRDHTHSPFVWYADSSNRSYILLGVRVGE